MQIFPSDWLTDCAELLCFFIKLSDFDEGKGIIIIGKDMGTVDYGINESKAFG